MIKDGKVKVDPESAIRDLTEKEEEYMKQFKENDE